MKVDVTKRDEAIEGNIYNPKNYDKGDGLYLFVSESAFCYWEEKVGVPQVMWTRLGEEPPEPREPIVEDDALLTFPPENLPPKSPERGIVE